MKPESRVVLHRFGDCAAVAIINSPGTVYLDAKAARALARHMARLARDIERAPYLKSDFSQVWVDAWKDSAESRFAPAVKRGAGQ